MSREIMIIAKNKDGVVSNNIVKIGENGEHIVIKGTKDTFYEIKDMATNRAPDQIYTKRFKNDLKLKINPKGGALDGMGEADVTIENYCANGNCEIVGVHETGEYYQYVPQSGDKGLMTTNIADGEFAYQSLGTVEAGGFGPLSLLPLAGLGGLGGGGGKKPDTTAPDAPNLTMVADDYDAQSGYSRWGADIDEGSWKFDSIAGEWSVSSGNVNVTSDGTIITNDNTPTFSGTGGEAGATVAVYNGTILLGSAVVGSNGDWSVPIDDVNKLADGKYSLFLTQTDTTGNVDGGTTVDVIVDTVLPAYIGEINIADANGRNERGSVVDAAEGLGNNYYFTNEITLSDDYLKATYKGIENVPYTEGDSIYIKLYNEDTGVTYLIGGPNGPSVVVDSSGTWSVDISSVNVYNVVTAKYETLADGEYSGEVVVYEPSGNVRDVGIGNFAIDTTAPTINTVDYYQSPDNESNIAHDFTPTIGGFVNDYSVLSERGDDGDDIMERDQDYLIGTTAAQIFVYRDGVSLDDPNSYDDNIYVGTLAENTWAYTETTPLAEGVYRYQVDTMDVAGNTSGLGDSFWIYVDADNNNSYDLSNVQNITSKDFENMVLVGDDNNETFIVDSVAFTSIDGGTGADTLNIEDGSNQTLTLGGDLDNHGITTGFEIYDIGDNKLVINSLASVQNEGSEYTDHALTIQGTTDGKVDLDATAWEDTKVDQVIDGVTYNVYHNNTIDPANTNYDLWIQTGVSVI